MTRWKLVAAVILAILLLAAGTSQWVYLDRGYTLGIVIDGGAATSSHVNFPWGRKLVLLPLGVFAFATLWLFASSHPLDRTAAWAMLAVGLLVALSDVREYGTLGSPTTLWALLLLLAMALMVQLAPRSAEEPR